MGEGNERVSVDLASMEGKDLIFRDHYFSS